MFTTPHGPLVHLPVVRVSLCLFAQKYRSKLAKAVLLSSLEPTDLEMKTKQSKDFCSKILLISLEVECGRKFLAGASNH